MLTGARPLFRAVFASRLKQNSLGGKFVLLPTSLVTFRIIGSTAVIQGTPLTKVERFIEMNISRAQSWKGLLLERAQNSRVVVLTILVPWTFLTRTNSLNNSSRAL